jgi:hypothetical protein
MPGCWNGGMDTGRINRQPIKMLSRLMPANPRWKPLAKRCAERFAD